MTDDNDGYLTSSSVLKRFDNISRKTLRRWVRDPCLGFPQPLIIGDRWYFKKIELDAFEERRKREVAVLREGA
ncbi:helix-turn-helix domain-containing protein [Sinorhizobium sp. 7-81]|uniref:helix-turn-helix transcriptional regulator n=1 Tax=Sinorhizobium sp. 8-89 TaxID=3049089 RepID=UPI0024C3CEF4|nr:helix-turn-helix domain-containing protein [Sinorhizobium sp. 8-89]MDK1490506.1 helix-turn-helix domain-containing protein [Sinorhizobium sp. 8-89]